MENNDKKFFNKNKFYFVGNLKSTDCIKRTESKNYVRASLSMFDGVSSCYCESFSWGIQDNIYGSINGKWTKTAWSDRFSVVKNMRYSDKFFYKGKELPTSYDLINEFEKDLKADEVTADTKLKVSGDIVYEIYNNEAHPKFQIKSIEVATEKDKVGLRFVANLLLDKESMKETERGLEIDAYSLQYMKLEGEDKSHPRLLKEHYFYDDETGNKLVKKEMLKRFKVDDGFKAVCLMGDVFRAAPEVTVQPLTETQKLYIELGLLTQEEAEIDNKIVDSEVKMEFRVKQPAVRNQFSEMYFVPNNTEEFIIGIEPVVPKNAFDFNSELDSDLDDFFSDADMPF